MNYSTDLIEALRQTIGEAVARSADELVRIDIDAEIPIAEALIGVLDDHPDAVVGPLDRRLAERLGDSDVPFEDDSQRLTVLRNDQTRAYPIIYVGSATGSGQQGLRDIGVVVGLTDLLKVWRRSVSAVLTHRHSDHDLEIRLEVANAMFVLLEDRSRTVRAVDAYFSESILKPGSQLTSLQTELWRLGLIPDENLVAASIAGRIMANLSLIDSLLEDNDNAERQRARLGKSTDPRVQSFVKYIDSSLPGDLSGSDFKAVADALKADKPGTTSKKQSVPNLIDVLGSREVSRSEVLDAVAEALSDLPEGEPVEITIDSPTPARVSVHGGRDRSGNWISPLSDSAADDRLSGDQVFMTLRLHDADGRSSDRDYPSSYLVAVLDGRVEGSIVAEFLTTRANILKFAYLLSSNDLESLELLIASEGARTAAEEYVIAWQRLLQAFDALPAFDGKDNIGILLALGDGIWSRQLSTHETLDSPVVSRSDRYDSVHLAPFHPWRLDPLVTLARQVVERSASDPGIAGAAAWAVDKAVPIFRVLSVGPNVLSYTTREGGSCEFTRESEEAFPPISSKVPELRRAFAAYQRTHPWSRAGATITFINPPVGGLVTQTANSLHGIFGHEPQVGVVRDLKSRGVDRNIVVSETVEVYDVDDLISAYPLRDFGRDITVCFLAGLRGRSQSLGDGAYGPIDIVLASRGLGIAGELFVPQIKLRPDDSNETIALLHRVGGVASVSAATFDLALPPTSLDILPAASTGTEWIVVAAPAFVSAFPVVDSFGRQLHLLTEFDDRDYRFFVLARVVEPIGEAVRQRMVDLPISSPRMSEVRKLVDGLAESLPQKVFDVALNRFGAEEALGLINARAVATAEAPSTDLVIELSLDHASWAQQLIGDENRRADLVIVNVSADAEADEPLRIKVVEAKATSSPFFPPRPDREPFTEAIGQADSTREFLVHVIASADDSLLEGIQLRALIEQLAARAASAYMSDLSPDRDERFRVYFGHISSLSTPGRAVPPIDSLVVTTFLDGIQPMQITDEGDLRMVSASSLLLEQVLRGEHVTLPPASVAVASSEMETAPSPADPGAQEVSKPNVRVADDTALGEGRRPATSVSSAPSDETVRELVDAAARVLRLRSESVGGVADATTAVGPTFVAISLPFERGASLAPLQRSESDVARDLGVSSVEIGNDEQGGRIRILVPRPDRQFPELQPMAIHADAGSHYLPFLIGKDLKGTDFRSAISSWPHALVAGSTGSGKTTFLRSLLSQLNAWGPERASAIVVDGKGETDYFGLLSEELFVPEYPEPQLEVDQAISVLDWLMELEVPRRKKVVLEIAKGQSGRVDAKSLYLQAIEHGDVPPLAPLVVVIDEFNEIMIRGGNAKDRFVNGVTSVAQTARSVLVHLVLATQRPDRTVVPGSIKANLPARIALRLPTAADSVTVLGHGGAEKLLGWGDMLLQLNGEPDRRLQSFIVP